MTFLVLPDDTLINLDHVRKISCADNGCYITYTSGVVDYFKGVNWEDLTPQLTKFIL